MVQQEPEHAGAWLDLAILQCKLGYAQEAERLFAEIEARFQPPPGIREIIARLRAQGCAGWQPVKRLSLMVGRGISDNVNQGASTPNFTIGGGVSRGVPIAHAHRIDAIGHRCPGGDLRRVGRGVGRKGDAVRPGGVLRVGHGQLDRARPIEKAQLDRARQRRFAPWPLPGVRASRGQRLSRSSPTRSACARWPSQRHRLQPVKRAS